MSIKFSDITNYITENNPFVEEIYPGDQVIPKKKIPDPKVFVR